MLQKRTLLLVGGTLITAIGIGVLMQLGENRSQKPVPEAALPKSIEVTDITMTSAESETPEMRVNAQSLLPDTLPLSQAIPTIAPLTNPSVSDTTVRQASLSTPLETPEADTAVNVAPGCEISFNARSSAGAMVDLSITAPCLKNERATVHHSGLMFTLATNDSGQANVAVPAFNEKAVFILAFANGEGAVAQTTVASLQFYDRVAIQWKGDSGLELHAREFGADYFTLGHVSATSVVDMARTAEGLGGFITRLGDGDAAQGRVVEIYSFPTGAAEQTGEIEISVEAEVSQANCDQDIEAQTMELHQGKDLHVQDLTLSIPECSAAGDFLVLKNLIKDLTIASN